MLTGGVDVRAMGECQSAEEGGASSIHQHLSIFDACWVAAAKLLTHILFTPHPPKRALHLSSGTHLQLTITQQIGGVTS